MDQKPIMKKANCDMRKMEHTRLFSIYLIYVCWLVAVEWINFLPKFLFDRNLPVGIAEALAFLGICAALFLKREHVKDIRFTKIDNIWLYCAIGLTLFSLIYLSLPDTAFDTTNYHLIAQNPHFENYFTEDLAYGNFQVWGFRLCDRVFYYFRLLLGFKMGTVANSFALVVSYVQIYVLLKDISGEITGTNPINRFRRIICSAVLWAFIIALSHDVLLMQGVYYTDMLAIPVLAEVVRVLIHGVGTDKNKPYSLTYFAALCGIMLGMKLTNVIYVIPAVIIYLICNIRVMKLSDWIKAMLLGIIPWAEYAIWNYKCTKNPLFPYYNTIFKSPYFPSDYNFIDDRWGPTNAFEKTFWIVFSAINPDYRQSEIPDYNTFVLKFALVAMVLIVIISAIARKKPGKEIIILITMSVISAVLWAVSTGYSRYYIAGRVLWGCIAYLAVWVTVNRKDGRAVSVLTCFAAAAITVLSINATMKNVLSSLGGINWTWNRYDYATIAANLNNTGRTYESKAVDDIDMFALTHQGTMGYAELLDSDAYAANVYYLPLYYAEGRTSLDEKLVNPDIKAYDIYRRAGKDIKSYVSLLDYHRLKALSMEIHSLPVGDVELVRVGLLGEGETNHVWSSDEGQICVLTNDRTCKKKLTFIGGRVSDNCFHSAKIRVYSGDSTLKEVAIDPYLITEYTLELDLEAEDTEIYVDAFYDDNREAVTEYADGVFMLNYSVTDAD